MGSDWWKDSVVYQVYPRSFRDSNGDGVGDLNGVTEKLDYLKELGIDVIWLSPVYASPNDDNGYDISDYRAIQPEFGTMADFDRLLAEAHRRGIRIVMDLVANHSSDEHPWFLESRSSLDSPKRDWYIWRDGRDGAPPNNWGSAFSGSAWERDEKTGQYYLHLFSRKQPDLNWACPAVREALYDMMRWWCDKGVDGFRMDVIALISKPDGLPDGTPGPDGYAHGVCESGPRVHDYLREMRREVLDRYDLLTVGECGVPTEEAVRYACADGSELNMIFQFEHVELDGGAYGKWSDRPMPFPALKKCLARWQNELDGRAWNSLYFCNHDQPRSVSRLGSADPALRERSAKCIATMLHGMQGTPYVYQGEELGMTNYPFSSPEEFDDIESINGYQSLLCTAKGHEPDELFRWVAYKSRDNARTPMQWDGSANAGFTTGTPWLRVNPNYTEINAAEQLARADSVFRYYQKLIALRHSSRILRRGHFELLLPDDPDLFVCRRYLDDGELTVVCNLSDRERSYCPDAGCSGRSALIQNIPEHDLSDGRLAPYEAYILG